MPALSPTMSKTGGKIVRWLKNEGDKVKYGEVIAEVETDKAVMEMESADDGIMAKILSPEGISGVPVKQVIAIMASKEEYVSSVDDYIKNLNQSNTQNQNQPSETIEKKVVETSCGKIKASPLAKVIAEKENIDLKSIKGTGPYGRIIKANVLEANNTKSIKNEGIIEVSSMRQVIAQRLLEAKQTIPHFYLTIDCQIDKLLKLREEINSSGSKVTINDFIIKAVALGMEKSPEVNASWAGDKILKYSSVDISVAVALEDGLITPIVKNANQKNISIISKEVKELVSRAKSGKLKPEEFQGGGFTISNLGMFGIKQFSAIINPPQSCIMSVGASEKRPIVVDNKVEIANMVSITLSVDHRTVDGALAARFLSIFKSYIEAPLQMLL
ncbi:MAG: dihydrolipoyllysine-residue acetyltransferase component of pyruvate dehydrogenase complex [Candidatus Mesenet longicola]|uniref:Dihydrolipoamide acetyltransferase component of pyruvate dehydrogenase complex n=1 Tax=Candidatus Mesenet longicola TaxID=1892558 RepID=A0A8J3MNV6_9RICK|nr:MAG: dihydrolipoyllysine-residue acetyltransferase component of pyruvate dehydrogenase complex [Candidatus Mesenet longicola]GHM59285.1 MAG: dihydrolipoyllysine-residue acetyltransferase component of pyruvate dehydrogenase complex [Candidatus Mesenet longicola]